MAARYSLVHVALVAMAGLEGVHAISFKVEGYDNAACTGTVQWTVTSEMSSTCRTNTINGEFLGSYKGGGTMWCRDGTTVVSTDSIFCTDSQCKSGCVEKAESSEWTSAEFDKYLDEKCTTYKHKDSKEATGVTLYAKLTVTEFTGELQLANPCTAPATGDTPSCASLHCPKNYEMVRDYLNVECTGSDNTCLLKDCCTLKEEEEADAFFPFSGPCCKTLIKAYPRCQQQQCNVELEEVQQHEASAGVTAAVSASATLEADKGVVSGSASAEASKEKESTATQSTEGSSSEVISRSKGQSLCVIQYGSQQSTGKCSKNLDRRIVKEPCSTHIMKYFQACGDYPDETLMAQTDKDTNPATTDHAHITELCVWGVLALLGLVHF